MTAALVLLLVAQAELEPLKHASRSVRDQAITRLAAKGPASGELVGLLTSGDELLAAGVAEILRRRVDAEILPRLARIADRPAADPAAAAASLLVETAGARRVPLHTLHFDGWELLGLRLKRAVAEHVRTHLAKRPHGALLDEPQVDRPLYAMAGYAGRALVAHLGDRVASEESRAAALFALARLRGRSSQRTLLERLDDPSPRVRRAAASLLLRYGDRRALERLARLLESDRTLQSFVRHAASIAVRDVGRLNERGVERLRPVIESGTLWETVDAVRALRATHPALAQRLVDRRAAYFGRQGAPRGHALRAAWLQLKAGPLREDVRARMRKCPYGVAASVFVGDEPLARLRPELTAAPAGRDEPLRLWILYTLLRRNGAPAADRLAFAKLALDSGPATAKKLALWILQRVDDERWTALRPRVVGLLDHRAESVRLAAAALLPREPAAFAVCVDALYDGDPIAARTAARLIGEARPELAPIDPEWPVRRRRQATLELARGRE